MGTLVLLDLMGGVALLLWGLHMVQSGTMRAFGPDLRRFLSKALLNRFAAFAPGETAEHSSEWWRQGSIVAVDLHRTLQGVRADSEALWSEMSADTEVLAVADTEVEVPTEPARALVVVIHAAHHGIAEPKPLRDL